MLHAAVSDWLCDSRQPQPHQCTTFLVSARLEMEKWNLGNMFCVDQVTVLSEMKGEVWVQN